MKKVLSILLVLVLCTSLMALTVSAAGNASLKATNAEVAVGGGTATIEVSLSSNPGVMAMQIVPSVPAGFSISMSGTGMGGGVWTTGKNAFWDNDSDSTYTGKILTVTVTVDASVDAGEYKITFSGSGSNYDEEDVSFSGASATIKVVCDHSWGAWTETKPATCGEDGEETRTCSKCGETETKPIPATGKHNYVKDDATSSDATCGKDGKLVEKCSVCGDTKETTIPATGKHTYTYTDLKDGKNHKVECSVCGHEDTEGHTWGPWKTTVEPDEANKKDGEKQRECEYCDAHETKKIPWDLDDVSDTGDITSQVVMTGAVVLVVMMGAVALVFKRKIAK